MRSEVDALSQQLKELASAVRIHDKDLKTYLEDEKEAYQQQLVAQQVLYENRLEEMMRIIETKDVQARQSVEGLQCDVQNERIACVNKLLELRKDIVATCDERIRSSSEHLQDKLDLVQKYIKGDIEASVDRVKGETDSAISMGKRASDERMQGVREEFMRRFELLQQELRQNSSRTPFASLIASS